MPEALAHDITRVLFEQQPELATIHPQARELTLGSAVPGSPIPVPSRRDPLLPRAGRLERLGSRLSRRVAAGLAFGLAAYALYWVVGIVEPQIYRASFLLIALVLTFLIYPARERLRGVHDGDRLGAGRAFDRGAVWPIVDLDRFVYRAATPTALDLVLGAALIVVVLEATRRTSGWILPVTAVAVPRLRATTAPCSIASACRSIAHRGYAHRAHHRHALHDARRHLRRAARRRRHLHRAVHHLRRRPRTQRRRPVLRRLGDGRDRPVRAAARRRGGRSRSPAICSARCRAAASPTR